MRRTGGRRTGVGLGIGPTDVAALAIHLMSNTALTGATYASTGQQFGPG